MKPAEFNRIIKLLRDSDNETDFIVKMHDMVEYPKESEPIGDGGEHSKAKKAEGYQIKICRTCGKEFMPNSGSQKDCDNCKRWPSKKKKVEPVEKSQKEKAPAKEAPEKKEAVKKSRVERDIENTAAELAAMSKR